MAGQRPGPGVNRQDFDQPCAADDAVERLSNPQIPSESLPDYRTIHFEAVAPAWRRYLLVTAALWWLFLASLAGILGWMLEPGIDGMNDWLVWCAMQLGVLLLVATSAAWAWMDAGRRGWALREHDVAVRKGVIWHSITLLPIARIQHVESSSGPLERLFGLARLKLHTAAGGMNADMTIVGLEQGLVERLREHLARRLDALAPNPADGERDDIGTDD